MIQREYYMKRQDNVVLYRTYSDEGYKIKQHPTGIIYDEAIDVETANFSYTETNEKVEVYEEEVVDVE